MLIEDGDLKKWVRLSLIVIGITFVILGVIFGIYSIVGMIFFLFGFLSAAIGGYATQAHTLKIKPFDRSYEKAKKSYLDIDEND